MHPLTPTSGTWKSITESRDPPTSPRPKSSLCHSCCTATGPPLALPAQPEAGARGEWRGEGQRKVCRRSSRVCAPPTPPRVTRLRRRSSSPLALSQPPRSDRAPALPQPLRGWPSLGRSWRWHICRTSGSAGSRLARPARISFVWSSVTSSSSGAGSEGLSAWTTSPLSSSRQ